MDDTQTIPEPVEQALPVKKSHKRQPPLPPVQNPTILALEVEILDLVRARTGANSEINAAKMQADQATVLLRAAQERLITVEKEVQYRIALIRELKGGAAVPTQIMGPFSATPTELPSGFGVSIPPGVGSIPTAPAPLAFVAPRELGPNGRPLRTESAEDVRAAM